MEIRIDSQTLEHRLQNERFLGEVVLGIEAWLRSGGLAIERLSRDSSSIDLADRAWERTPVEEVGLLEVTTRHPLQDEIDRLRAVSDYLRLLFEHSTTGTAVVKDLIGDHEDVAVLLDGLEKDRNGPWGDRLRSAVRAAGALQSDGLTRDALHSLTEYARAETLVVEDRLREVTDPQAEMSGVGRLLGATAGSFGDVSVLLQSGRDREAMQVLLRFTELFQKLLRVSRVLDALGIEPAGKGEIGGRPRAEYYGELNTLLAELSGAMEVGDSVLTADLLEYEIAPRLVELAESFGACETSTGTAPG